MYLAENPLEPPLLSATLLALALKQHSCPRETASAKATSLQQRQSSAESLRAAPAATRTLRSNELLQTSSPRRLAAQKIGA